MKIGAPGESDPNEQRVALVPETVERLVKAGHEISIGEGAGTTAGFPNSAYTGVGATMGTAGDIAGSVDIFVHVQSPTPSELSAMKKGTIVVGLLNARTDSAGVSALAAAGVTALSMELVPRIARAQRMDVLSSQASIAGYKAALLAANSLGKYLPMMMTAAGTIPPARVLVLGAGVAGLQAIATARRLGAVVEAFDVRAAALEQRWTARRRALHGKIRGRGYAVPPGFAAGRGAAVVEPASAGLGLAGHSCGIVADGASTR